MESFHLQLFQAQTYITKAIVREMQYVGIEMFRSKPLLSKVASQYRGFGEECITRHSGNTDALYAIDCSHLIDKQGH